MNTAWLHETDAAAPYFAVLDSVAKPTRAREVIVQKDVADLWNQHQALLGDTGRVLAGGCEQWTLNLTTNLPAFTSQLSHLDVPYFGWGPINEQRSLDDATCRLPGEPSCIPDGLLEHLDGIERDVDATASFENSALQFVARAFTRASHRARTAALRTVSRDRRGKPPQLVDALATERAWNLGLTLVDTQAWHTRHVTERYEAWLEANARDAIWPSNSLPFGLGLPFLALLGDVQCFENGDDGGVPIAFEQGLGVLRWDAMRAAGKDVADLDDAFALHFNGDHKPWDTSRCVDETEPRFAKYASLSPKLYEQHLDELARVNATKCSASRRLYGGSSLDGTDFATYAEAYLWA